MKIGIDIRAVCGEKTGKGWYTYYLVKELLAFDAKNHYILYTHRLSPDLPDMLNKSTLYPKPSTLNPHLKVIVKHPALWHFAVIKDWQREEGDIFFAPTSYIIPAFLPKKYASVITVHDLIAFLFAKEHQTKAKFIEKLLLKRALRKTRHVLVPSENTKRDLAGLFHYPESKITVTPLGVDEVFFKNEEKGRRTEVQKKYQLPEEFILTVSGLEPRKNVGVLIDAVQEVRKKHSHIKLVILGGKGWKSEKTQQKIKEAKDFVIHIENCSSEDLRAFYHLAKIFVFPSLYEGFGLPPLEAMASGCPVICSNAGSLPEVVNDTALLFNPQDRELLKKHIEKVLEDKETRQKLTEQGKKRASQFSWKKTSEKTLSVLEFIK